MNTKKEIYETGATSHAVNNLILFTDTTPELTELRDKIYSRALTPGDIVYAKFNVLGALAGNASLKNAFSRLLRAAIEKYKLEFKQDADQEITSIRRYDDKGNEFAKIYVAGFHNWKSEHGYK